MLKAESAAASAAAGGGEAPDRFSRGYRGWLLFILCAINALNLADRQGMAATAPAIKIDLQLTDTQLGLVQGLGFAIFYTLMGLPMARLAERRSRAKIISLSIGLFGAMVALCGSVRGFWQLLMLRVGVGIGDAGFGPPVASLVGDHYPMRKRASAMTIIWLGAPIGAMAGAVLGGWVTQHSNWRYWFIGLGVPSLLLAVIAWFTLRDPPRGMSDPQGVAAGPPPSIMTVFRFLSRKRSMIHILIGAALAAAAMNGIGQFLARFLVGVFHIGYAEAGTMIGIISTLSMASGLALGGFGMDWASRFDIRWYVWGPAIGLALAMPLFWAGVNQSTTMATMLVLIPAHAVLFVYYTPTLAIAQNMVGANMRASAAFLVSFVLGFVGIGFGPTIIGIMSDLLAQHAFTLGDFAAMCPGGAAPPGAPADLAAACSQASADGIRNALGAITILLGWAAVHYLLAGRSLRRDLDTHYEAEAVA